jgi:hypothetical protein
MPLIKTVIVECDVCKSRFEIADKEETKGAEKILHLRDAMDVHTWFCSIECLRKWAGKYSCPYKTETVAAGSVDEILPGLN